MGSLTLAEMREELRFTLGGRSSADLPNTNVDRWLTWSYHHISQPTVYPHRELLTNGTTTLATDDRDIPFTDFSSVTNNEDVVAVRSLINETHNRRLVPRARWQIEEKARDRDGTVFSGEPVEYAVDDETIYLYRAPSSTYNGDTIRLHHWRPPVALTSSGAASELATIWDEVIVQGGVWRGWRALDVPDRSELAKVEFATLVNEVTNRLALDVSEDWHRAQAVEIEVHQER